MIKIINTKNAPAAIGPYSQAIALDKMLFTSGQLAFVPATMKFIDGGIKEQSRQALLNLKAILEESGSSLSNVLKTTCFIADMNDFAAFNEVYQEIFNATKPARSCVEVARLPKDALIEIEAIAFIG